MSEDEKLVERVSLAICMVQTGDPDIAASWADEARAAIAAVRAWDAEELFTVDANPELEKLAVRLSMILAGPIGGPGLRPDAVMVLEMAEELYRTAAKLPSRRYELSRTMLAATAPSEGDR